MKYSMEEEGELFHITNSQMLSTELKSIVDQMVLGPHWNTESYYRLIIDIPELLALIMKTHRTSLKQFLESLV